MRSSESGRPYTPAGVTAALAGVFVWGLGVVFVKLTSVPFLVVAFYRHAFSIPVLALAFLISRDRSLPWRAGAPAGVLFAFHQMLNFSALRYSTAAVVTILFSLQPIVVGALGGRFVGETASRRFYLWSTVAIVGCAVVVLASTGDATTSPLGATLAVANLATWCVYYLMSKKAREDTTAVSFLFVMTSVSGVVIAATSLIVRTPLGSPHGNEWLYLALLGIVSGTLGHLLVVWAHPRIHVAASSALVLGVPIVGTAGTAIFIGEPFGVWQAVGAGIALLAAGVAMRYLPPLVTVQAAERYGELAT